MIRTAQIPGIVLCAMWLSLMPFSMASTDTPDAANLAMQAAFPPELTAMFPIGREFKGVAIPSYNGENLKSVMRSASVTRINERYLDLLDLVVLVYNGSGEAETTISMDEALYDMQEGILRSKTPSRIEQPQFTMTGDTMIFHQQTHVSRLEGNVKVVIPDADKFTPATGIPLSK